MQAWWQWYGAFARGDVIVVLHISIALVASAHAVLKHEDPRGAVGWVGLIWLSPFIGAMLYYIFGINRIRRSAVAVTGRQQVKELDHVAAKRLSAAGLQLDAGMRALAHVGNHVGALPLLPGNKIEPLVNGDEAYPAMLAAIRDAKRTVLLASYIFDNDQAGRDFARALGEAVKRGVEVRVLVDATGSRYSFPSIVKPLRKLGVKVALFMPNLQPTRIATINMRSHRKIMVVDGVLGFTGGMNIRAGNYIKQQLPNPTQDLHFRVRGPVVAHLRQAFIEDWAFTTREVLDGELWLPALPQEEGGILARGVLDGPDRDFEKTLWTILGATFAAKRRIRIITPYFLPDPATVRFLSVAVMAGVEVEIILPERNNILLVQWAARAILPPLLHKGCRVYLSPPPFDHSKVMLVDDAWALIGSANWDARSLRLNFEFNIECYDREFASKMNAVFDAKLARARRLDWLELEERRLPAKLRDGVMRLAAPYL